MIVLESEFIVVIFMMSKKYVKVIMKFFYIDDG